VLSFPPFRLDLAEERLWRGECELRLRRKPFAILRFLAQNPRRLVAYSEVVEAVWGRIAMSESLVRTHMHDLRRVLGERVIETVVGRGYRFIRGVEIEGCATAPVVRTAEVGRARHLGLVPTLGSVPAGQPPEPARSLARPDQARLLKQIADAFQALGTSAVVVVIVGDPQGACLQSLSLETPDERATSAKRSAG